MLDISNIKIAIIGLGYVGLPLAVEFGKHRPVVGFDINTHRVAELSDNIDSTLEVSSDEMKLAESLTFTTDLNELADCNFYIITVPTPIDENNSPDFKPLKSASTAVAPGYTVDSYTTISPSFITFATALEALLKGLKSGLLFSSIGVGTVMI